MRESIEQCNREFLVTAEHLRPLGERKVRCDEDAPAFVASRDQVEQELAARSIERDEANLVEDQKIDALEFSLDATELSCITSLDEYAHEIGGTRKRDMTTLTSGLDPERDREMRFARADRSCE
jgi:hypothetical protein